MTSVTSTEQVIKDEKHQTTAYILLYTLNE
jgi:hypothetical protein